MAWIHEIVGHEQNYVFAFGCPKAILRAVACPKIPPVTHIAHPRIRRKFRHDQLRVVRRVIVQNKDFNLLDTLVQHGPHCLPQIPTIVIGWNDDAQQRRCATHRCCIQCNGGGQRIDPEVYGIGVNTLIRASAALHEKRPQATRQRLVLHPLHTIKKSEQVFAVTKRTTVYIAVTRKPFWHRSGCGMHRNGTRQQARLPLR
ncbi:hypothetical protein D3C76_486530 [compost metagenome]